MHRIFYATIHVLGMVFLESQALPYHDFETIVFKVILTELGVR